MKNYIKLFTLILLLFVILFLVLLFIRNKKYQFEDTIFYKDKTYGLLEYNMDNFTYNYNINDYLEEDIIHPIKHDKWNILYFNGDLFVLDKQVKNATKYYSNNKNYEWYVVFDNEIEEVKKSISISNDEITNLYNINNKQQKKTITFEEIELFSDIMKVSKDGLIQGITTLVKVDDNWYYKTEKMTEDDKEIVINIDKSLNKKINDLLDE